MSPSVSSPLPLSRIVLFGGLIVTLAMGVRHTFGLFLSPVSQELGWGREVFALAIAVQNLLWGAFQPITGMLADRWGGRRALLGGALCYVLGLALMALSTTPGAMLGSAGLLIGLALSGTTYSVVYGEIGRHVAAADRSRAMGMVGAAGSLGQFLMLPIGQGLIDGLGWSLTLLVFAVLVAGIVPAGLALTPASAQAGHQPPRQSARAALLEALGERGYLLLCFSYLVCGFQVVFIGMHLPSYLVDQGLDAKVGTTCLALIGLFNVFGTYLFGQWGGRWSKARLLAGIYVSRSITIVVFLLLPLSPASAMVFASVMGFLWLSTVPLTNGLVAQVFGVHYLAMLGGFAFFAHQIGSFLGVWLGGRMFDLTGSYQLIWLASIALGVLAGLAAWPIRETPLTRLAAQP